MRVTISGLSAEGICARYYIRAKSRRHLCELLYPGYVPKVFERVAVSSSIPKVLGLGMSDLAVIVSINMLVKSQQ